MLPLSGPCWLITKSLNGFGNVLGSQCSLKGLCSLPLLFPGVAGGASAPKHVSSCAVFALKLSSSDLEASLTSPQSFMQSCSGAQITVSSTSVWLHHPSSGGGISRIRYFNGMLYPVKSRWNLCTGLRPRRGWGSSDRGHHWVEYRVRSIGWVTLCRIIRSRWIAQIDRSRMLGCWGGVGGMMRRVTLANFLPVGGERTR